MSSFEDKKPHLSIVPPPEPDQNPDDLNIWDYAFDQWGQCDPAKIPPRRWLYGKHYLAGALSATIADGGVGKSILDLTEAVSLVTGQSLLGVQPAPFDVWNGETFRRTVFYYNAEEEKAEIQRRVCAICQHFGIDQKKVDNYLTVVSGHDYPAVIGGIGRNGVVEFNERLLECFETDLDVIMFDPFVSIYKCRENDNDMIDAIVKRLMQQTTKCHHKSIELLHHTRKTNGHGVTDDDGRGASALRDGVRALRYLNPMTEAEAQRFKVDDPSPYFRMNDGKANYSARASAVQWFKHVSVLLPNGDDVGVVERWTPPGMFDALTPEHVQQICELVKGGEYRSDAKVGTTWVGNVVADVLDLNVESEVDREQIRGMIGKLLGDGVLKKVTRRDKKNRNLCIYVEPAK